MRNPAKAGTSLPYPLCLVKAGVGSASDQPSGDPSHGSACSLERSGAQGAPLVLLCLNDPLTLYTRLFPSSLEMFRPGFF